MFTVFVNDDSAVVLRYRDGSLVFDIKEACKCAEIQFGSKWLIVTDGNACMSRMHYDSGIPLTELYHVLLPWATYPCVLDANGGHKLLPAAVRFAHTFFDSDWIAVFNKDGIVFKDNF